MSMHSVVKSGEVVGVDVKNSANENLGEIAEMVVDKTSGKVSYLVLEFGGFMSFGNKFFAVPWHLFTYDSKDDCFILSVDKQRLKDAPGFDKDHWPDFASNEFRSSITNFYQ